MRVRASRNGALAIVVSLASCCGLLAAGEARGATVIGQDPGAASSPCSPDTFLQTGVASGTSYTVPVAGVITGWFFHDGSPIASGLKLKVARQSGVGATIIGEAAAPTIRPANTLNGHSARIPVQTGDLIGIYTSGTGPCSISTSNTSDTFAFVSGDLAPGSGSAFSSADSFKFPLQAAIEADADNDGFGDESQDFCDTDPTTQGPCHPGSVSFGSQTPGTVSSPQTITLKTTAPNFFGLVITSISASGDFQITSDGCSGHVLSPNFPCQLAVAFAPTAAGIRTGTLSITDPAANGSPHTIALTGTGVSPPTGQRAAALASCKKRARKHHWPHKRLRKCKKKANLLPI